MSWRCDVAARCVWHEECGETCAFYESTLCCARCGRRVPDAYLLVAEAAGVLPVLRERVERQRALRSFVGLALTSNRKLSYLSAYWDAIKPPPVRFISNDAGTSVSSDPQRGTNRTGDAPQMKNYNSAGGTR